MRAIPPCLLFLLAACSADPDEQQLAQRQPGEEQAIADAEAMLTEQAERVDAGSAGEEKDKP